MPHPLAAPDDRSSHPVPLEIVHRQGGRRVTSSRSPVRPHRADRSAIRYVAIGDSIARGFALGAPRLRARDGCGLRLAGVPLRWFDHPEWAYPALVAREVAALAGCAVHLDERLTCSGLQTEHLWSGGAPTPLLRVIGDEPADLITVTLGANDLLPLWYRYLALMLPLQPVAALLPAAAVRSLATHLAPEADRAWAVADGTKQRLGALIDWVADRWPRANLIVTTYFPGDGPDETKEAFSRPLRAAILAAAGPSPATVVELDAILDATKSGERVSRVDRLHPTAEGQRLIAAAVVEAALSELGASREP